MSEQKAKCNKALKHTIVFSVPILLLFLYSLFGGAVFYALEHAFEPVQSACKELPGRVAFRRHYQARHRSLPVIQKRAIAQRCGRSWSIISVSSIVISLSTGS